MKRILSLITFFFLFSLTSYSQNAKVGKDGNYVALSGASKGTAKPTGKTFTDGKGAVLPVFKTDKDRLFVMRKSAKTGKEYKMYLKLEQ